MAEQALPDAGAPADRAESDPQAGVQRASPYAYYVLFLLLLASIFNYIDRNIVSVVGNRLRTDLHLNDAELGFVMGTAFAVFYGVIGIAMGRIADSVRRTRLMALGIAVWSAMTGAAGFAAGFGSLAVARMGVGTGEATATPCSQSLLVDYFPARNRSLALGVYQTGPYLGGAVSLVIGGQILQHWNTLCASLPFGACRLTDWRAAFLLVGAPGVLLALLIATTLREPPRLGLARRTPLLQLIVTELSAAVPPFTLLNLYRIGGATAVVRNLLFAAALVLGAVGITRLVGDPLQWGAVALGVYSVTTWGAVLRVRDRPVFALTFGCPTFVLTVAGGALIGCVSGGVGLWSAPYAMRTFGANPGMVGLYLGVASAISSSLSILIGASICDVWKRHDRRAPIWICMAALIGPIPALLMMPRAQTLPDYVMAFAAFNFLTMIWGGATAALIQDLVLQRMRGTAAAAFGMIVILISSGIGPYWVGKISTLTGSLTNGLYSLLVIIPIAIVVLLTAAKRLPGETPDARRARARAAGEVI
jgi:MFS family permease